MPNTHDTLASLFGGIADAIRAKTGGSADIVADDFPSAISAIPTGGTPTLTDCDRQGAQYGQCYFSGGTTTERRSITPSSGTKYFVAVCEVLAENTNTLTHTASGYAFALTDASGNIIASGNGGTAGAMSITLNNYYYQFAVTITEDTAQTAQYVMKTIYEIK